MMIHWRSLRSSLGRRGIVGATLCVGLAVAATVSVATSREAPFLAENDAAMQRMMAGMHIKPSGDVDQDFATMMIPHHQGAIDMAVAELRYGSNERLRRIAQEIIVSQQQEIAAMRLAVGEPLPSPAPAPTQVPLAVSSQPLDQARHSPH
jgi:hypothetical protein